MFQFPEWRNKLYTLRDALAAKLGDGQPLGVGYGTLGGRAQVFVFRPGQRPDLLHVEAPTFPEAFKQAFRQVEEWK